MNKWCGDPPSRKQSESQLKSKCGISKPTPTNCKSYPYKPDNLKEEKDMKNLGNYLNKLNLNTSEKTTFIRKLRNATPINQVKTEAKNLEEKKKKIENAKAAGEEKRKLRAVKRNNAENNKNAMTASAIFNSSLTKGNNLEKQLLQLKHLSSKDMKQFMNSKSNQNTVLKNAKSKNSKIASQKGVLKSQIDRSYMTNSNKEKYKKQLYQPYVNYETLKDIINKNIKNSKTSTNERVSKLIKGINHFNERNKRRSEELNKETRDQYKKNVAKKISQNFPNLTKEERAKYIKLVNANIKKWGIFTKNMGSYEPQGIYRIIKRDLDAKKRKANSEKNKIKVTPKKQTNEERNKILKNRSIKLRRNTAALLQNMNKLTRVDRKEFIRRLNAGEDPSKVLSNAKAKNTEYRKQQKPPNTKDTSKEKIRAMKFIGVKNMNRYIRKINAGNNPNAVLLEASTKNKQQQIYKAKRGQA